MLILMIRWARVSRFPSSIGGAFSSPSSAYSAMISSAVGPGSGGASAASGPKRRIRACAHLGDVGQDQPGANAEVAHPVDQRAARQLRVEAELADDVLVAEQAQLVLADGLRRPGAALRGGPGHRVVGGGGVEDQHLRVDVLGGQPVEEPAQHRSEGAPRRGARS